MGMHVPYRKRDDRHATQIACLACGATRVVYGVGRTETGECQRCRYTGWDYSDELDGWTRRMIADGSLTGSGHVSRRGPRRA